MREEGELTCFHSGETEAPNDLRKEQRNRLKRNPETNLNSQKSVSRRLPKDLQRLLQIKLLIHHRRRVNLNPMPRQLLLLLTQERRRRRALREIPEGEDREEKGQRAFDEEEVAPWFQRRVGDVEDAEGEKAREGVGDVARGVEDGEAPGEFAAAVERC